MISKTRKVLKHRDCIRLRQECWLIPLGLPGLGCLCQVPTFPAGPLHDLCHLLLYTPELVTTGAEQYFSNALGEGLVS